ncbi:DNA cytosine methyltransferase [Herbaspirillum frisingense]|uniref:DNA cytosine methyltransferase n=1 Tax=Herbaspirillum frisingense TaxID=92645 RepID=UPI0039AEAB9C
MRIFASSTPTGANISSGKIIKGEKKVAKIVSFFAGCGGLDLGFVGGFTYRNQKYAKQPFEVVQAYDFDAACEPTYKSNVGEHFQIMDLAKAKPAEMPRGDILIGGFPCQEFSICGPKGGTDSKRGSLFKSMSAYAKFHQPLLVIAENVAHLPRMNEGNELRRIKKSFADAGYRCIQWDMYAPDYGVPQARQRVVLVFVRKDIAFDPLPPRQTFAGKYRSVEWAISDLIGIDDETVANQSQYFKAALAKSGNGQGDETSPRNAPGYTVRANAKSRVQFHYALPRRLTIRECARLQTFPDNFVFPHAATTNIRQIGNAVPPVMAHAIATSIGAYLEDVVSGKLDTKGGEK